MVGLDRRGGAAVAARLDHVGVERALDEEARVLDPAGLLLEDADELLADDLPLGLGIVDSGEAVEEAVGGVDVDELDAVLLAEGGDDLLGLVLAHHPVVDEDAGQPVADRAVDEERGGRGVDAAGEAADRAGLADLRPNRLHLLLDHRRRRPLLAAAADVAEEAGEDLGAVRGVDDLGVELDPVQGALGVLDGGHRGFRARGQRAEARRRLVDRVAVAHPALLLGRAGRRAGLPPPSRRVSWLRPNSPAGACSTRPPSSWTISCIP